MQTTPQALEALNVRLQSRVPCFGLGFKVAALDRGVYERILTRFKSNTQGFRMEDDRKYLQTIESGALPTLLFEDRDFNKSILKELRPLHQDWCGMPLVDANCYGIRVYQAGSYLYNHVDRFDTHVISSSICVDCQINRPWPLYIEDIDGNPHEVDLQPGEMIFYESALLKHGRPYPLDGDYYAGMYVHYTPEDWHLSAADLRRELE